MCTTSARGSCPTSRHAPTQDTQWKKTQRATRNALQPGTLNDLLGELCPALGERIVPEQGGSAVQLELVADLGEELAPALGERVVPEQGGPAVHLVLVDLEDEHLPQQLPRTPGLTHRPGWPGRGPRSKLLVQVHSSPRHPGTPFRSGWPLLVSRLRRVVRLPEPHP